MACQRGSRKCVIRSSAMSSVARLAAVKAIPADHPVAHQPQIRLADLAGDPFIVGSPTAEQTLMRAQFPAGFQPRIDFAVEDWTGKLGCVAAGLGVALVPALATHATPSRRPTAPTARRRDRHPPHPRSNRPSPAQHPSGRRVHHPAQARGSAARRRYRLTELSQVWPLTATSEPIRSIVTSRTAGVARRIDGLERAGQRSPAQRGWRRARGPNTRRHP